MKRILLALIILFIIITSNPLTAQVVEYVNSILWSDIYTINIANDYAYCGFSNGVVILDTSDPSNILQVSQVYLGSEVLDLDINGDYLYAVTFNHGLRVIDISNPYLPVEVSHFNIEQPIAIEIYGQIAFIIANTLPYWGGSYTFNSIDIADPFNPRYIDGITINSCFRSLTVKDNRMYIAENFDLGGNSGGIRIISVYYSGYFYNLGRYETTRYTQKIVSNEEYLYLLDNALGLLVIESLTLGSMHVVNHIIPSGDTLFTFTRDFCIDDDKVYCLRHGNAPNDCWLEIYNIEDSPEVEFMSYFSLGRGVYDVIANDGYAYFYNYYEPEINIEIVDATNAYQPVLVNDYFANSRIKDIDLNGEILFAAFDTLGFTAIDFADPANPLQLWSGGFLVGLDKISSENNIAIVNDEGAHNSNLIIFDISNINEPESISTYHASVKPLDIEIIDNYIYLNGNNGMIEIVDISNPEQPIFYSYIDFISGANDILVQDNRAYISCGNDGMKIINIDDPANPTLAGVFNGYIADIKSIGIKDTIAYLANDNESIFIVNIADLQNINVLNEVPSDHSIASLAVIDNYLGCCEGSYGLYLYSLEDPANPVLQEQYNTPGSVFEIIEKDEYFILNDRVSIIILQLNPTGIEELGKIPTNYSLSSNYPNPFNASTTIRYNLPNESAVTLDIFDILGRKVQTLYDGFQTAGSHSLIWNADSFSSGTYFYGIKAGEFNKTDKMTLIK